MYYVNITFNIFKTFFLLVGISHELLIEMDEHIKKIYKLDQAKN